MKFKAMKRTLWPSTVEVPIATGERQQLAAVRLEPGELRSKRPALEFEPVLISEFFLAARLAPWVASKLETEPSGQRAPNCSASS